MKIILDSVITTQRFFYITFVQNYDFNTQYSIKCQVKINGQFGNFGPACILTTPAAPTTQLRTQFCNTILTSLNQNVYADVVVGTSAYKFKVENNGNVQEIERPDSRFSMSFASNVSANTVYNVSVALFFNGAWQPYGPVCTLTTPMDLPTSQLRPQFCNGSVTAINSNFFAVVRVGAQAYKFKTTINGNEVEVTRPDSRCFMSAFAGAMMNRTYQIQVAVQFNGVWSEYGPVCNLTVGTIIDREISEEAIENFEIIAYPNPFTTEVNVFLSLNEIESKITIIDMMGKQIQQLSTQENEVSFETSDWAAGVYVIQIVQGHEVKNIRVVKQ